jgi:hypothetical protein
VRWNWIVDLPVGKGKPLLGNAGGLLNRIVGGWQIAGLGSLHSTYWSMPTDIYPTTGNPVEMYGYKYPVQDCTTVPDGGICKPGYLWWNGYIRPDRINSHDPETGLPNGIEGVPANYKPAGQPLNPWPVNPDSNNPMYPYYGSNTVWVPITDSNGNAVQQRVDYAPGMHPWQNQFVPGPLQWNVDASVFKTIPIAERFNLRLNFDAFNVFNRPGNPSGVGTNGVLSTVGQSNSPRTLQLTGRLTW